MINEQYEGNMRTRKKITMAGTVLLCIAVLASCTECGEPETPQSAPGADRSVRLSAGLQAVSRAAIDNGSAFTASVGGWESASGADYGKAADWLSSASVTASESASDIVLTPQQYYSQNGAERTYIKAWYPKGSLGNNGTVTFAGDADYKGDGTDDILLSGEVSGSASDCGVKTLAFRHPLTQLKFTVQGDAAFGSATTVKSITLKEAGVPTGLDLKTDAVSASTPAAGVPVPGIDGTQTITTASTVAGQPVMVVPFGAKTFKIDVVTTNAANKEIAYRNVTVTVSDDNTLPGKAYAIALSFAGYEVSAQASVVAWDYTGTGSGDVCDH